MKRFEELDHTADVGIRAFGRTFTEALVNAAHGMISQIGEPPDGEDVRGFEVAATDRAEAVVETLRGILLEFNRSGHLPREVTIADLGKRIRVRTRGGTFDPERHVFFSEVKGVTEHGLRIAVEGARWVIEVVLDV